MFVVSGATGHTGSSVAKNLLEKNLPVRVIVRNREKASELEKLGAEIAIADLQNSDELAEALKGATVLYLMNPPAYGAEDQFVETKKNIESFQMAIENTPSLEKIVALSSFGSHLSSGTGNIYTTHLLEKAFANSKMPITFIRAGSFMENWTPVLETAKTQGILPSFFQPLDQKVPQVASEDIGRVAAESMQEKTSGGEIKELAGFYTSPIEVAEAIGKVLGKDVKPVAVPREQWIGIMSGHNSPKNAENLAEMFDGINSGHIKCETDEQIEGKITLEDFFRKALK